MAGPWGRPVARSHRRTVSPWLPMPTACTGSSAASRAARPAATIESSSSWGSCSTAPPAPACGCTGALPSPRTRPPSTTTIAFVADVPWSIARTFMARSAANLHRDRGYDGPMIDDDKTEEIHDEGGIGAEGGDDE